MHKIFLGTIFLSAFLLFQVQPLIGRFILPWFGGAAGVWSVMMVFFQFVLLAGYVYAHLLTTRLKPKAQMVVHLAMLTAAVLVLPVVPPESMKPAPDAEPISSILLLLGATVGLPYFVVSTTNPLVQAWFARSFPEKSPYWLYALSNGGSLLALLSYPFIVEPLWGRNAQALIWSGGFGLFALLCSGLAIFSLRGVAASSEVADDKGGAQEPPTRSTYVLWIGLPALASTLLLAFTNEICVDIASVPFLWILPLGCYLLSFIVTFSGKVGLRRKLWHPFGFVAVITIASVMYWPGLLDIPIQIVVFGYIAALFVLCCILHGEVYSLRPGLRHLTLFYVCVSIGGVLGGIFVGIFSPLFFDIYMELPISLFLCFVVLCLFNNKIKKYSCLYKNNKFAIPVLIFMLFMIYKVYDYKSKFSYSYRNFYGVYSIQETKFEHFGGVRSLFSGTTLHGAQYTHPEFEVIPTQYFSRHSGVGIALASLSEGPKKIGIVGLGVGTLAAYGRTGDTYRFYEINPASLHIAQKYFTFLQNSHAKVDVALGDGRLSLEKESPQSFDMLILDAFTSDSIPVHLLTIDAFKTYASHISDNGAIVVHISNRHVDLSYLLKSISDELGFHSLKWSASKDIYVLGGDNEYIIMTRSKDFTDGFHKMAKFIRAKFTPPGKTPDSFSKGFDLAYTRKIRPWTDDFSNLFTVLKPVFRKRRG
jgi:hypothetical protein